MHEKGEDMKVKDIRYAIKDMADDKEVKLYLEIYNGGGDEGTIEHDFDLVLDDRDNLYVCPKLWAQGLRTEVGRIRTATL